MTTITLRSVKGSPLTNAEVDANFSNLNSAKYESGDSPDFVDTLTDKLSLDITATGAAGAGEFIWNADEGTADLGLNGGTTILQLGQETHYRVINKTASTITNGTLCMYDGTLGASGQIKVKPWVGGSNPALLMGIATADIAVDARGYVTNFGKVRGIDTSGSPYGETWISGDILYAGPSGGLTNVMPTAPNTKSVVAAVVYASASNGELLVRVTLSSSIQNDDAVQITSIADKDLLQWNNATTRFENKSLASAGVQPTLVSGTNIKSIGSTSLLGSGNITSLGIDVTGSAAAVVNSLSAGTGLSGTAFNGSAAVTWTLATAYGDSINPYGSKTANYVLAAPNGTAGVPTFRAIVAADIPTLNQNTTGTASNVTGTVAIANGGTGATTRQDAMDALAGAVTSGQYLRGNGTDVVMSAIQAADVPTLNQNTTGSAATLTTGRTIGMTGDVTWTSGSFDGSANVTGTSTLATVNSNIGSFGSSSAVPVITVDGKGRITAVSTASITSGLSVTNDTTTATSVYPAWTASTSGTISGIKVSSTKLSLVPSTGTLTSAGNFVANSDERLKTNWRPVREDFIYCLADLKSGIYDRVDNGLVQAGVSAQSLKKMLPEAVETGGDGVLSVAYGNAALVAAVELAKEVVALRAELDALKEKVNGN